MKKMVSILFFLVLVSVNSFAGTEETGAWSEPVDGLRGRLIVFCHVWEYLGVTRWQAEVFEGGENELGEDEVGVNKSEV